MANDQSVDQLNNIIHENRYSQTLVRPQYLFKS